MAAEGNVGLAFGLVVAAGMCTVLGACFAFFANVGNNRLLAGALGVSAGVMLYVSFVEIFAIKAVDAFVDAGYGSDTSYRYATFLFFAGLIAIFLLDKLVHSITSLALKKGQAAPECCERDRTTLGKGQKVDPLATDSDAGTGELVGTAVMESAHATADPENGDASLEAAASDAGDSSTCKSGNTIRDLDAASPEMIATTCTSDQGSAEVISQILQSKDDHALKRMGVLTALAIGIHNLPEGLATFVATLADPTAGIAIAVAIAMHNIPEGVCVAMPVYYATGSRWKGFLWAFLSGVSEPLGGLLGWVALYGDNMSDLAYGCLFALVGGMMVYIALKELIPTALRYDPDDRYVTWSVFGGMAVMAGSLLMFTL